MMMQGPSSAGVLAPPPVGSKDEEWPALNGETPGAKAVRFQI